MATASELKAILDAWIAPRINQDAGFASGSAPTANRLNELFNLLIDQGDSVTSVLATVRDYLAAYTEEVDTTIANNLEEAYTAWLADRAVELQQAIDNANSAVTTANAASTTANTAATNAGAAQTAATQAATDANAAKNVAVSAAATANAAATTANAAASAANNAVGSLIAETATGTGTAIVLTNISLIDGFIKTFVAGASNAGAATTVNGKPLYMPPNTTTAPNIVAGKIYTIVYNLAGTRFFLEASAEGDATAAHVLASHRFSNGIDVNILGTMAPKLANVANFGDFENSGWNTGTNAVFSTDYKKFGAYSLKLVWVNPETVSTSSSMVKTISGHKYYVSCWAYPLAAMGASAIQLYARVAEPSVYSGALTANTWNLVSGIVTFASTLTDRARVDVNAAGTVYFDGFMVIDLTDAFGAGNEPDLATMNAVVQTAGGWWDSSLLLLTGDTTATDADVLLNKIYYRQGIKGVGTVPVRSAESVAAASVFQSAGTIYLQVPKAYHDGSANVYANDPDFIAPNLLNTANAFGLVGDIPNRDLVWTPVGANSFPQVGMLRIIPPRGYYPGDPDYNTHGGINWSCADFTPGKILKDAVLFGMAGTAQEGIKFASGTVTSASVAEGFTGSIGGSTQTVQRYPAIVSGLTFKPDFIILIVSTGIDKLSNIYYCKNPTTPGHYTISCDNGGAPGEFYHDPDYTPSTAYVNATGFKLPGYSASIQYRWIALQCGSQGISWS